MSAAYLYIMDPGQAQLKLMSGLIWIQTVWDSDDIPKRTFWSANFEKKNQQTIFHAHYFDFETLYLSCDHMSR